MWWRGSVVVCCCSCGIMWGCALVGCGCVCGVWGVCGVCGGMLCWCGWCVVCVCVCLCVCVGGGVICVYVNLTTHSVWMKHRRAVVVTLACLSTKVPLMKRLKEEVPAHLQPPSAVNVT